MAFRIKDQEFLEMTCFMDKLYYICATNFKHYEEDSSSWYINLKNIYIQCMYELQDEVGLVQLDILWLF